MNSVNTSPSSSPSLERVQDNRSTVTPSSKRVRIQGLSHIVLFLSALAAIPGFFGSLYCVVVVVDAFDLMNTERVSVTWPWLLAWLLPVVTGWWLLYTYWLELNNYNRFGRISWLVSAGLNIYLPIFYREIDLLKDHWLSLGLSLLWSLTMIVLSLWIWVLHIREKGVTS
jgi:hypothetical protein